MAQAEHGAGAQSVLVSPDPGRDRRRGRGGWQRGTSALIETDSLETAIAFVNEYAPEHLQLARGRSGRGARPDACTPERSSSGLTQGAAFGDYVAGSNHILPTAGNARFSSGWDPWCTCARRRSWRFPSPRVAALEPPLVALALAEGLPNHARSAPGPGRDGSPNPERTSGGVDRRRNREVIAADGAPKPFAGAPYNQAISAGNSCSAPARWGSIRERALVAGGDRSSDAAGAGQPVVAVLAGAGLESSHVVRDHGVRCRPGGLCGGQRRLRRGTSPSDPPARSTVQVAALPAGAAVEIEVIALA